MMPSKSPAQRRTMAAASHNPEFAKKVGIPVSVAKEFNNADKRRNPTSRHFVNALRRTKE
jgi:hypothetical protein